MMPAWNWGIGALNCPGDPGCPGYVVPGSNDQTIALLNEILANQTAGGATVGAPVYIPVSSGFDWSSIPIWAWGAGAFLLALVFLGARRR